MGVGAPPESPKTRPGRDYFKCPKPGRIPTIEGVDTPPHHRGRPGPEIMSF